MGLGRRSLAKAGSTLWAGPEMIEQAVRGGVTRCKGNSGPGR